MEKIQLSNHSKVLLLAIANSSTKTLNLDKNSKANDWLKILEYHRLIEGFKDEQGNYILCKLSLRGAAYLDANPKLKNPSYWDDKHKVIEDFSNIIGLLKPF